MKALLSEATERSRQEMRSKIYPKQYTEADMKKIVRNIRNSYMGLYAQKGGNDNWTQA